METQLFFDLTPPDNLGIKVHFCESADIASVQPDLKAKNIALFELDGATIHNHEQLFPSIRDSVEETEGLVRR